jgi:hypothetical protein
VSYSENCNSVVVSRCCYKLVAEAGGPFGNPEQEKSPPLEAVIEQRLVKTRQTEKT